MFDALVDVLAPEIIKGLPIAGNIPSCSIWFNSLTSRSGMQRVSLPTAPTLQRARSPAAQRAFDSCSTQSVLGKLPHVGNLGGEEVAEEGAGARVAARTWPGTAGRRLTKAKDSAMAANTVEGGGGGGTV